GLADLIILATLLANLDGVSLAHLVRRNVDFLSVHLDVAVTDELTSLGARGSESERVDDVVQPQLELAKKILAGDPGAALGALEIGSELRLQQTVNPLDLLLLPKLQSI